MKRLPYLWIGIFSLENLEIHGEISATIKKGGPNYLKSKKSPVVGQSRLLITKGRTPSKGRNNAHWGSCRYNIYIYIYIYTYVYVVASGVAIFHFSNLFGRIIKRQGRRMFDNV